MAGNFIVSLDYEKYWGMIDEVSIEEYRTNLDNTDRVVFELLALFRAYGIHATWAVVGFMFYNDKTELLDHLPENTTFYSNSRINTYEYIKNHELEPRYHFAPETIRQIMATPDQEIASHTFSHYYCLEPGQSLQDFEHDIQKFSQTMAEHDLNVRTLIFPKNQINHDYLEVMTRHGYRAYRGNEDHFIYREHADTGKVNLARALRFVDRYINLTGANTYRIEKEQGIFDVRSSRFLAPWSRRLAFLEGMRLNRIKSAMSHAARNNENFHLWWHPHNFGCNMEENLQLFTEVLKHFKMLETEYQFTSRTIDEAVSQVFPATVDEESPDAEERVTMVT